MSGPTQEYDWGHLSGDEPPERTTKAERLPVPAHISSDIGLLVLRVVVGGVFIAHGVQKVFGLFGGLGPGGTAEALAGLGFSAFASPLAWVLGVGQLVLGALLVLGLLTPFAAAALLGAKVVAIVASFGPTGSPVVPLFAADGPNSLELHLLLAAATAALVFAGAGRIALDVGRTYQRRPLPWAVLALVVGVGVALLVLLLRR